MASHVSGLAFRDTASWVLARRRKTAGRRFGDSLGIFLGRIDPLLRRVLAGPRTWGL